MTTISTGSPLWTATLDHRTGATFAGGPASCYRRGARCDGRPSRRHVRPNYRARRVGAVLAAFAVVMMGAWLAGAVASEFAGTSVQASAPAATVVPSSSSGATDGASRHVARPGDTLWSIADRYRGGVDRERFIDALVELNGSTSITIGQAVRLP